MASSTMEESKLPGGYLVTPRVPQGLAAAVEGLTREVIRNAPEDIYVFAAHHFEKLLQLRERCGTEEMPTDRENSFRTAREISQALRMREADYYGPARTDSDQFGWSLNQTAKVLKRHRSIFGEAGRRISTDEVFQMANQKENRSQLPAQTRQSSKSEIGNNLWKASTSRTERSWSNEESTEVRRSGPRIITQIPNLQSSTGLLAKDIKTELRKNRISSRERRNVRAKPEDRTSIDRTDSKTGTKGSGRSNFPKKSSERQKRSDAEVEKRNHRSGESSRSSKDRQQSRATPESRALSMDRVKGYVVQKFATTKSLEELQSLTYVEKVQGIIDETGPIIKGKVEELKSGMIGRSKRSSWFATAKTDSQKGSNGSVSAAGSKDKVFEHRRSEEMSGETADALKKRLTETQQLLENVSSKMGRPRRSRSARSSQRSLTSREENDLADSGVPDDVLERRLAKTKYLLEDISSALSKPMRRSNSAKSLRRQKEIEDCTGDALKMRLDETKNLLEGISASFAMLGHRGRRGKASGNVGTEENSFLESSNTSQVSLPAVRSASAKTSSGSVSRSDSDHLVLPAISPEAPKSKKVKEDLVLPVLSPPGTGSSNTGSKIGEEIDDFAEEDIPEIPVEDYEPEPIVEDVFKDSLNVTPDFDSVPQRPDSLDPPETAEEIEPKPDNLEERLQEIQRVQEDIEKVFTMKQSENLGHSDEQGSKKNSLKLDEAEKKIDKISDCVAREQRKDVEPSVEAVDKSVESESNAEEEVTASRAIESEVDERKEDVIKDNNRGRVNVPVASPETLNYTYVLTEGSPYEIPDTVTTVIIPERSQSPEMEEEDVKLSPVFESPARNGSKEAEEVDTEDTILQVFDQSDEKSATNQHGIASIPPKDGLHSQKDESPSKNAADPFGELIEHEPMESVSIDIDFIRGIESRQEMRSTHQDLVPINEEISEDLEAPEEHGDSEKLPDGREAMEEANENGEAIETPRTVDAVEKSKGEAAVSPDGSLSKEEIKMEVDDAMKTLETIEAIEEIIEEHADRPKIREEIEDDDVQKVEIDQSKSRTESELSPEASRPHFDSESSNEAKESSGPDEPLELAKCPNSVDEEESSDSRSPESSNEVKETTLTDGLSLSLDPTRPFVPDLNLDSLQDLTVSSFKMTEDEYDNQAHVESGNTNSITDTLASDENHRFIENVEEVEYFVSSSDRSKQEESGIGQEEIVEVEIVKSQVEIKEDPCVKSIAYVTGPSKQGECLVSVDGKIAEEQDIQLEEKEEMETVTESEKTDKSEGESSIEPLIVDNVDDETEEMAVGGPVGREISEVATTSENGGVTEGLKVAKEEQIQEDKTERSKTEVSTPGEDDGMVEGESEVKSVSSDVEKNSEIEADNVGSLEASVTEVMNAETVKMEDQTTPSADLSGEIQSVESDETIEESFVEEETPLAVSRSASQCTTRRVSSGNLARLREDPTLGWTEETEQEIATDDDASVSKVTFSKIGGETIKEQGSDELEPISASPESANDEVTENLTKDSKEYHIYVSEVGASEDKSTTESSTVESAVTKIQARVRGFLTRRRIHRGQQNRSSTLNSIPSIQDSIAVEYYGDDQQIKGTEGKISSALTLDEPELENAVTTIQSNYRAYKARNRLRREDAIQRTTFSLEKSFAESGLQHTGEFHDCIPLPLHDITIAKKVPIATDINHVPTAQQLPPTPSGTDEITSTTIKDNPENVGQMFFGQSSSNLPLIQFGITPNIGQLVDLVVQANEEAELQSGYLNFITSVEDTETVTPEINKTVISDVNCPHESLKEPLALSVTPLGVVIEEVTTSDAKRYLNFPPEIKSPESQRAPCASSETITESTDVNEMEDSGSKGSGTPETREAAGKDKENRSLPTKSSIERLGILECSSLPLGKDLLPESSVDSMECPVIGSEDKSSFRSSDFEVLEKPSILKDLSVQENAAHGERNSSTELDVMKEDETWVSNEPSSTLSFSIKVEDLLGLGAEESPEVHARKPILEVTLTPADIMKSMSSSQESQLAGERIESPITMVQMAPARAESLLLQESGADEEKPTNTNSGQSEDDQPS